MENKTYYRFSNITLLWVITMTGIIYWMGYYTGLRQLMLSTMLFIIGVIGYLASYLMKKLFWIETGELDQHGEKIYNLKTYPLPRWLNIFNAIVAVTSVVLGIWFGINMRYHEYKYTKYTEQYTVSLTPSYYIFEFSIGEHALYIERSKVDTTDLTKLYKGVKTDIFGDTVYKDIFIKHQEKMLYLHKLKTKPINQ